MSALKKTFVGAGIFALGVFGSINANAQTKGKAIAFNGASGVPNEIVNENNLTNPVANKGTVGEAVAASRNGKMAIHIFVGTEGKMSGDAYAKILANAFADRKYTDKPMYIKVTHNGPQPGEEGEQKPLKEGPTTAMIFMDGARYSYNGVGVFTPEEIGGAVQIIGNDFVSKHGDDLIIPENTKPILIASLNKQ